MKCSLTVTKVKMFLNMLPAISTSDRIACEYPQSLNFYVVDVIKGLNSHLNPHLVFLWLYFKI